jgi:serine-type D-Ala-D-Ala carboxypeptidase/endopeptidase (penicillin-binding protein 4)
VYGRQNIVSCRALTAPVSIALVVLLGGCAQHAPPLTSPPVVQARDRHIRALQRDLASIFDVAPLQRGLTAVVVESLTRGDVLFRYHGDTLVMPASNMKLVTLAAAAERLGWDYAFETTITATGPIEDGVVRGDLVIVGSGDPSIGVRDDTIMRTFDGWAEALWQHGIRRVDGRVIGDDNAFDEPGLGSGWAWDDLGYGYAAPIGALQVNDDAAEVRIVPAAAAGMPADVVVNPPESGLLLVPHVMTDPPGSSQSLHLQRYPGSPVLTVTGSVPALSDPLSRGVAIDNPTIYFVRMALAAFAKRGIVVLGGAADIDDISQAPVASGAPLVVHRSPSLGEMAGVMMKVSQNQYAETLLRAVGRSDGRPATVDDGVAAVRDTMAAWRVPADALVQADGSGLSRYNYVTAGALVTILRRMHGDPRHRDPWVAAMPVGGVDGTLRTRFRGSSAEGRVHAKTGTLANVRALSGYLQTRDGEWLAFAMIVNNVTAPAKEIDAVTERSLARLVAFHR